MKLSCEALATYDLSKPPQNGQVARTKFERQVPGTRQAPKRECDKDCQRFPQRVEGWVPLCRAKALEINLVQGVRKPGD
eukprot:1642121-Lingulodinium_polyedra.AAC.1